MWQTPPHLYFANLDLNLDLDLNLSPIALLGHKGSNFENWKISKIKIKIEIKNSLLILSQTIYSMKNKQK